MKKNTIILFLFLFVLKTRAQEFRQYANGLIYSETTVGQLKHIVDSLNLKFKVCNDHPDYTAVDQGKAHYLDLFGPDAVRAKDAIEAGINLEDFVQQFPRAEIKRDYLAVRTQSMDEGKVLTEFRLMKLDNHYEYTVTVTDSGGKYLKPVVGQWVFAYREGDDNSLAHLEALYVTADFTAQAIPLEYARMIQYVDCMVDTNYRVLRDNAAEHYIWGPRVPEKNSPDGFLAFVNGSIRMPEEDYKDGGAETYSRYRERRDSLRWIKIDSLSARPLFKAKFRHALDLALKGAGIVDVDMFEDIVERYDSPANALELKRRRLVVGGCSQDESPRIHAQAIARLSAEAVNWDIFLRAHLDIMNDHFDRRSDASYAWVGRKTYIRELEALDFDVPVLLLGTIFHYAAEAGNHYRGSISRIGRALSETGTPEITENKMLQVIRDSRLDLYNRLLFYYLFLHYNDNLEDKGRQTANTRQLEAALATFPEDIRRNAITSFDQ
ncbi:hypothetical protein [Taibaiella koreensis]|uniref:hypothetical protein n=1 Tax=Taibaiella koreensis TaxID=1268548 RepID=UPI000E59B8D5|nr:hypothetical protein [Taibaiella koreensis]